MDRRLPCVLCSTPQSYEQAVNRFVKKTGYTIEQWSGRILMQVPLPSELSQDDLIAVAQKHFPEMDEDYLALIASKAMQSEGYLKAVEGIAKRARYLAAGAGHAAITSRDVDRAIADILPQLAPASAPATGPANSQDQPCKRVAPGLPARRRRLARPAQSSAAKPIRLLPPSQSLAVPLGVRETPAPVAV